MGLFCIELFENSSNALSFDLSHSEFDQEIVKCLAIKDSYREQYSALWVTGGPSISTSEKQ